MRTLLPFFLVCAGLFAQSPEDLIRQAAEMQQEGRLTQAASLMREVLARPGLSPAITGLALNELGLALHNRNQFDEAEANYLRAIRVLTTGKDVPPLFLMRARMNLACLYVETRRLELAAAQRSQVSIERMTDVADQSQALSLTASLALLRNDFETAYQAYRDTLQFVRRNGPDYDRQVATTLSNLGTISYRRGRLNEALDWLTQAVAAQRASGGLLHPNLMKVLTNLAQVQIAMHRDKDAGQTLHEALNIARQSLGDDSPVTASILEHYAGVLARTGLKAEAKAARKEAAVIRSQAPRSLPREVTVDVKAFTKSAQ